MFESIHQRTEIPETDRRYENVSGMQLLASRTHMTDAEFDLLLSRHMEAKPSLFFSEYLDRDAPLSKERLDEIEHESGLRLPRQFKRFLSEHGAGDFALATVYSPETASRWSLWREYEFMPSGRRADFLPFADNGCGDYYGFLIVDGQCTDAVWWADHELDYSLAEAGFGDFYEFLLRCALNQ